MIPVIITSLAIVLFFLVLLITAIILLVNKVRKKDRVKRDLSVLIIITLIFFSLVGLDTYLISSGILKSGKDAASDAAYATGKGLVITYDAVKKTWDERSIKSLDNIDVTMLKSSEEIKDDIKTYEVKVLFTNKNSNAESMSIAEMIACNYLVFCDEDDIVYAIDDSKTETFSLPIGKSEVTLFIHVEKDVKLKYLRFVNKEVVMK
jgi:hypothetical protein